MSHGNTAVHIEGDSRQMLHTYACVVVRVCVGVCVVYVILPSNVRPQRPPVDSRLLYDRHVDEKPEALYSLFALLDKGDCRYQTDVKF